MNIVKTITLTNDTTPEQREAALPTNLLDVPPEQRQAVAAELVQRARKLAEAV